MKTRAEPFSPRTKRTNRGENANFFFEKERQKLHRIFPPQKKKRDRRKSGDLLVRAREASVCVGKTVFFSFFS